MLGRSTLVLALLVAASAQAQAYKPPRTSFGQPDLQGIWTNVSMTKLQRPAAFKDLVASPGEAAAFEKRKGEDFDSARAPVAADAPALPHDDTIGQDATEWSDRPAGLARIGGQIRTSWIVDPMDGKLPYNTAARAAVEAAQHNDDHVFDHPEGRPFDERCLLGVGGMAGPPLLNTGSNSHVEIVQTRDHVVIVAEMNHDARIVRLDDRRHIPAGIKPWMGDSAGWWEGDTLVVETTNFNPGERWHWNAGTYVLIAETARVTERFTRLGPEAILYRFEVEDPGSYTQVWRGEMPLNAAPGPIYEYACHEGNYALTNILAGARELERVKAERAAP